MSDYTIWHNPKCSTSRFVLKALRDAGVDPVVRDYQAQPPTAGELRAALERLGIGPRGLLRRRNTPHDALGLGDPALPDDALIAAMAEHPALIERPVVFGPGEARLCRPKEAVFDMLEARKAAELAAPNLLILAQAGRLEFEAIIFAASLRHAAPDFKGHLIVAEPQPEGAWSGHETRIGDDTRVLLESLGAEILPFTASHFGAGYPYGNKIEALSVLPAGQPFAFFDTDTLITGPLDRVPFGAARPAASMRREGTWPEPPLYGPGYAEIWKSLYDRFGLDFASSLDPGQPDGHWERYLYFNAGWFFGPDPAVFGQRFLDWALSVRNDPPEELACQSLDPWLDQVILPLVIHSLDGRRPGPELSGLDGDVTCHYRKLPLLYARGSDAALEVLEAATAPNRIKRRLKEWEPARKLIYQGKGRDKVRAMFAGGLPRQEKPIRQALKKSGWWWD